MFQKCARILKCLFPHRLFAFTKIPALEACSPPLPPSRQPLSPGLSTGPPASFTGSADLLLLISRKTPPFKDGLPIRELPPLIPEKLSPAHPSPNSSQFSPAPLPSLLTTGSDTFPLQDISCVRGILEACLTCREES